MSAARIGGALFEGLLSLGAASAARLAETRLSPPEIVTLARHGAGPGTSGVAGIRTTVLQGDPTASGPYTIALQVPPHTRIAAHTHRDDRSAVVVSGRWFFGYGAALARARLKLLMPGSFYTEPGGVPHFAMTGNAPAVVYITGEGPTDTHFTVIR